MTEFNINISVSVGVTPALEALLRELAGRGESERQTLRQEEGMPLAVEAEPTVAYAASVPEGQQPTEPLEQPVEAAAQDQQPQDQQPQGKAYQGKDYILEVMQATRRRIQGEDYENDASARNRKIGKMLTAEFKNIAMTLAASVGRQAEVLDTDKNGVQYVKPSRLPEIGMEIAFARSCDELELEGDEVVVKSAF